MTNFEFYCDRCKYTNYFECQIVLKDYTFYWIDNDLQKLLSIDKDDVFYFIGAWEYFEIDNGEIIKSPNSFHTITSNSKDGRNVRINILLYDWLTPLSGTEILYNLYSKDVAVEILDSFLPQLSECMKQKIYRKFEKQGYGWNQKKDKRKQRRVKKNRKILLSAWNKQITGWKQERDLKTGFNNEDKILYEKVQDMIYEFQPEIQWDSAISGEGQWCMIVWNTIQIVKNGGGENEVINHLSPFALNWHDKSVNEAEKPRLVIVAKEIVEFIKERLL